MGDLPTAEKKPTKGRGGKANFPSSRAGLIQTDEDRQLVSKLLTETLDAYKQPKVHSDEELVNRLQEYFTKCSETGQIPTVEEMALCTGYTYATWYDWETGRRGGFSSETANLIKKAKQFLATFDAKLVVSGKMNFLAYCFRAKNYYGMVDKVEHVVTPNVNPDSDYSAEDIRSRYITDSVDVTDSTDSD